MHLLTKSKYALGLVCPRHLWMIFHQPERIPEHDAATELIFEQGHAVGDLAKTLFPNGIALPTLREQFKQNIRETAEALKQKQRKPLFEAGLVAGNLYARADILVPVEGGQWDLVEVKSSTEVKDEHIEDVSFQKYCYEQAGLTIRKCFLTHINKGYVKRGAINPTELLTQEEITTQVDVCLPSVPDKVRELLEIINSPTPPETTIGNGCENGKDCVCEDCWNFLPEHNVFDLHRGGKTSQELFKANILSLMDVPAGTKLNAKQKIQVDCVQRGEPHMDKNQLKAFLAKLKEPMYYFDFETFSTAIPLYDGTSPYQQIPFQFSVHEVRDGKTTHHSFLADGRDDPRPPLLKELKKALGGVGSVVVYNQSFEKKVLTQLGEAFPEYAEWAAGIISRVVDLYAPFLGFHYYHPQQKGSASIKAVMPALTGKGYDDFEIAAGGDASAAFFTMTFKEMPEEEKRKTREYLEKYCRRDTEGMVWIVDTLREMVG